MNGKNNQSFFNLIQALFGKSSLFLLKNKRKALGFIFLALLYFFIIFLLKVSFKVPEPEPDPARYSQLYLLEFIGAYRDFQQDFDIEDVMFGEKILTFTLNVKFKTKSNIIIKKLAMDIMIGLTNEYSELQTIKIKVIKQIKGEPTVIYGKAVYLKEENQIEWKPY